METVSSTLPRAFGPFTLLRQIGQGGMGQVFLALRPIAGQAVDEVCVVKTVRGDLKHEREAVGRFLDEARVVQKLAHNKIARTLDAGVVDRSYYLALEFISGRNLRDVTLRATKLNVQIPEGLIVHACCEVLDALAYAHALIDVDTGAALEVVHRDISPHNLMLGFDGAVKLIDFGLAMHGLKREMTRPGVMVGKLRYNAPEQVRDRALDGRSDLYSVGVMLFELFTGERFYMGLTEEQVWRVAMKGDWRPAVYPTLPADLRAILDVALHPNPERRFADAADMRRAVLRLAEGRGIVDGKRATAQFMTSVFAAERISERDMILEATGMATAQTRIGALTSPSVVGATQLRVHSDIDHTAQSNPSVFRGGDDVSGSATQPPTQRQRDATGTGTHPLDKPRAIDSERTVALDAPAAVADLRRTLRDDDRDRTVAFALDVTDPPGPSPLVHVSFEEPPPTIVLEPAVPPAPAPVPATVVAAVQASVTTSQVSPTETTASRVPLPEPVPAPVRAVESVPVAVEMLSTEAPRSDVNRRAATSEVPRVALPVAGPPRKMALPVVVGTVIILAVIAAIAVGVAMVLDKPQVFMDLPRRGDERAPEAPAPTP
jgi:serine/threonine-protein kinase